MKKYLERFTNEENKPLKGLKDLSRIAATEGIVLLKNEGNLLPIDSGKINVFGRIQTDYYKSGTGSGGLVNVDFVTSIIDALNENPYIEVNPELKNTYLNWIKDNPFNAGNGMWASEPWSQTEMPLSLEIVKKAYSYSEKAVVIIGRTAGEDKDHTATPGSFYLRDDETEMISIIKQVFDEIVIVLNVGNVMDLSFLDTYSIPACLYAWHGGQEGGRAVSDILTGVYCPSGKLPDTITYSLEDYPAKANFGGHDENIYQEDIYVGYRYFNTFNPKAIRYPFGFGLSYTEFEYKAKQVSSYPNFSYEVSIKNIGKRIGKAVVQAYVSAPQGSLGKPVNVLVDFSKSTNIEVGETKTVELSFNAYDFASYDDSGITGYPYSYILEAGMYEVSLSIDALTPFYQETFNLEETEQIEKLSQALAPVKAFKRLKPIINDSEILASYEDVPLRKYDLKKRIENNLPKDLISTCAEKRTLKDVYDHKTSLDAFIAQLSNHELACLVRGEGMSSPKVTPGTASAFGGVTEALASYGIPVACCSDGPSGIRMDSGMPATSLPNGTNLAATFNKSLVEALYYLVGAEMTQYNIDILLGPGMNIHRYPLCGRNFEYFSEDPLLTGLMATSIILGLQAAGVTGTLKHLALNNQEYRRFNVDAVVSERAAREIYLKGFEIAVKRASAKAIMTSYNPINGIWAAGNFDLNTLIVRKEWGFKGIIMTDWWAMMNDEGEIGTKENTKAMIQSQNDLYMVVHDSLNNSMNDNTIESLQNGSLTRGELQKVAKNICSYLMDSLVFRNTHNIEFHLIAPNYPIPLLENIFINNEPLDGFDPVKGDYYIKAKNYFSIDADNLNHHPISIKRNGSTIFITLNDQHTFTYVITNQERHHHQEDLKIKDVVLNQVIAVDSNAWGKTVVPIKNYLYKNDQIKLNETNFNMDKDGIISYGLDVSIYGKYIVELVISSKESSLAQMPFSLLVGDTVMATLTTNGTEGKSVTISAQIILNQGKFLFSVKALRSGLQIESISLIRHQ